MTNRRRPRVRVVFYRSRLLTKIVVLAAVVLSMVALISLWSAISCVRESTRALRSQALQLEQGNDALQQNIDALGSPQSIAQIAQKELDLVFPDTVLFQPEN